MNAKAFSWSWSDQCDLKGSKTHAREISDGFLLPLSGASRTDPRVFEFKETLQICKCKNNVVFESVQASVCIGLGPKEVQMQKVPVLPLDYFFHHF